MSKKTKERKEKTRAAQEARRITPGKMIRLFLKCFAFAMLVALIFTALGEFGVPIPENFWLRLLLMVGVYLLAYPILMSEFRPKRARPEKKG